MINPKITENKLFLVCNGCHKRIGQFKRIALIDLLFHLNGYCKLAGKEGDHEHRCTRRV
jgi:hypothetical protein